MRIQKVFVLFFLLPILSFSLPLMPSLRHTSVFAREFHVSPTGNDKGTGTTTDPFATLQKAQSAVREYKRSNGKEPIEVVLHDGIFYLDKKLVLTSDDSGSKDRPIVWRAAQDEKPIVSGGIRLTNWTKYNDRIWQAPLKDPKNISGEIKQLCINGRRAIPARTPNEGHYFYTRDLLKDKTGFGGQCLGFNYFPQDAGKWLDDPNAQIVLYYNWSNSHNRIKTVDRKLEKIEFQRPGGVFFLGAEIRYYVTNSISTLDSPGEWLYDRAKGVIYYYPLPGEKLNDPTVCVTASRIVSTLLEVNGSKDGRHPVEYLVFRGLTFSHSDADLTGNYRHSVQGAHFQRGAFHATGLKHSLIENCEFAHLGEHGVSLQEGCHFNTIRHCHLYDLGGGGIYLSEGAPSRTEPEFHTVNNRLENNIIHDGGHLYAAACGIFLGGSASYTKILHNDIFNMSWVGIHAGWSWTSEVKAYTHHNEIGYNHIHQISNGVLNDVGGIYMLGLSTGTEVHHQYIHNVRRFTRGTEGYGGWGIYGDSGSSEIHIHDNVVTDTQDGGLHLHCSARPFGDTIENNIFAFAKNGELMRNGSDEPKKGLHAELARNIIYEYNSVMYSGSNWNKGSKFATDYNCFWTTDPAGPEFCKKKFESWQQSGNDRHSIIADPKFVDPDSRDFRLKPDSPALKLGFKPIDLSKTGVYGEPEWIALPGKYPLRDVEYTVARPTLRRYFDDFEKDPSGTKPRTLTLFEENDKAAVRISADCGANGSRQSLKIVDASNLKYSYNPHFAYYREFPEGLIHNSFFMKGGSDMLLLYEWRDWLNTPYTTGPAFQVNSTGELSIGGQKRAVLPLDQWIQYDVWCKTPQRKNAVWKLKISVPGQEPLLFDNIPIGHPFERLTFLGFISNGTKDSSFYIDDLLLESIDAQEKGIKKVLSGSNTEFIALEDESMTLANSLFTGAPAEEIKRRAPLGHSPGAYNVFLIRVGSKKILVDAGVGTTIPAKLAALGIKPEEISAVLLTHLHSDHVDGLLDKSGKAVYPNAEIYVSEPEKKQGEKAKANIRIFNAYKDRVRTFRFGETILSVIRCLDGSGHTPGQTVFALEDILFVGDLFHSGLLEVPNPKICATFDQNKEQAIQARYRFYKAASKNNLLIATAHLPDSGVGYIKKVGEEYKFVPIK